MGVDCFLGSISASRRKSAQQPNSADVQSLVIAPSCRARYVDGVMGALCPLDISKKERLHQGIMRTRYCYMRIIRPKTGVFLVCGCRAGPSFQHEPEMKNTVVAEDPCRARLRFKVASGDNVMSQGRLAVDN